MKRSYRYELHESGLIPMQCFFSNQLWCELNTEAYLKYLVSSDPHCPSRYRWENTLTRWPLGDLSKFLKVIWSQFQWYVDGWVMSPEIALKLMSLVPATNKSILVQVMACCHQATSHYRSQCWPRSLSPYGVTRPQWVNTLRPRQNGRRFANISFSNAFLEWKYMNLD